MHAVTTSSKAEESADNESIVPKTAPPGYVLVVDDEPATHALLGIMLKPLSLKVKYAFNGKEALDIITDERPSLIFLDLQMSEMSGFDVLTFLDDNPETADIPVIVFSALVRPSHGALCKWPSQVVKTMGKHVVQVSQLRELVKEQLCL